jgi:hypothetical protein
MAATKSKGGTDNGRGNGKGRGRPGAGHGSQGAHVREEGEPRQRSADQGAEPAGAGHDQDRELVRRSPATIGHLTRYGVEGLEPKQLLFLTFYLANGRKPGRAAVRAGIDRRTATRWLKPEHPVGSFVATESQLAAQGVDTVAAQREELEALLVNALVEGLAAPGFLDKEKAADLTARVLGLDKGGSEHDISSSAKAVFEAMGLALVAVATRGEIAGVEGDGIPANGGCPALSCGDGED